MPDLFTPTSKHSVSFPPDMVKKRAAMLGASSTESPQPAVTHTAVDPKFIPVVLPSNFHPYAFKSLHVAPILGVHQAKFNTANRTGSFKIMVETISTLLSGASAADLTVPDFNWLLYYLRRTNYVKKKMQHIAYCSDATHLEQVALKKLQEESLKTLVIIEDTTLKETPYDSEKREAWMVANADFVSEFSLGHPFVRDILDLAAMTDDMRDEALIDELDWLGNKAMLLDANKHGSFKQRIELTKSMTADQLDSVVEYSELVYRYGVEEFINTKCKECGADIRTKVSISAPDFL